MKEAVQQIFKLLKLKPNQPFSILKFGADNEYRITKELQVEWFYTDNWISSCRNLSDIINNAEDIIIIDEE